MHLCLRLLASAAGPSPARNHHSEESQEEFDALFDSVAEEQVPSPKEEGPPPLSDNDLAVFDPCYSQGENKSERVHGIPKTLWFQGASSSQNVSDADSRQ